ncbi:MAG TPA: hypothetical protein VJ821_18100 [Anaerolineales bacterium]|nr:hypothetical protein [Anaerolineales bacterium]
MSLIERYIAEVGRHLPEKDRADIEAEIRSMLEDMIEERGGKTGQPADDRVITEVLEQVGDPQLLAYKYAPPKRYLIGPAWYDVYVKFLQRVLFTALPIFAVVTFILTLTQDPLDFINAVGEAVGGAFNVGLQILFWITIVFVFLERSDEKPYEFHKASAQTWTVAQLPEFPRKRQIRIFENVMNIAAYLFVLLWIALPLMLDWFQGETPSVPFLHPNLWNFWLPAFFVLMGLTLVHELFQLRIGNWTPALTATNVILGISAILYIIALVTTQDIINPAFLATLDNGTELARLREVASWTINISAAVIVGIYVWDIVNSIRLARQLDKENSNRAAPMRSVGAQQRSRK